MLDALLTVYQELEAVCINISVVTEGIGDEYNDIEEVRMAVDNCAAMVTEDLEGRKDDPPSTESLTESWVKKHMPGNFESNSEVGSGSGSNESNKSEACSR